jgi:hypothetical protein
VHKLHQKFSGFESLYIYIYLYIFIYLFTSLMNITVREKKFVRMIASERVQFEILKDLLTTRASLARAFQTYRPFPSISFLILQILF